MGNPVSEGYITTTPYVYELDFEHILDSVSDFEKLGVLLDRELDKANQELVSKTVAKLAFFLTSYGLPELVDSIAVYPVSDGVSIMVDKDYAVYLEFGTGIKGSDHPHPDPEGWQYMVGEMSREGGGWWYPSNTEDPNPLKSVNKETGEIFAWTHGGLPSRPFMYDTMQWVKSQATKIYRRRIRNALKAICG